MEKSASTCRKAFRINNKPAETSLTNATTRHYVKPCCGHLIALPDKRHSSLLHRFVVEQRIVAEVDGLDKLRQGEGGFQRKGVNDRNFFIGDVIEHEHIQVFYFFDRM